MDESLKEGLSCLERENFQEKDSCPERENFKEKDSCPERENFQEKDSCPEKENFQEQCPCSKREDLPGQEMKKDHPEERDAFPEEDLLEMAYIGDSVYDLFVRKYVLKTYPGSLNSKNKEKTRLVCARSQSDAVRYLLSEKLLSPEEEKIYRRGRNRKSETHSKNSSIKDYRRATGFEALLGTLYMAGRKDRLKRIEELSVEFLEKTEDTK